MQDDSSGEDDPRCLIEDLVGRWHSAADTTDLAAWLHNAAVRSRIETQLVAALADFGASMFAVRATDNPEASPPEPSAEPGELHRSSGPGESKVRTVIVENTPVETVRRAALTPSSLAALQERLSSGSLSEAGGATMDDAPLPAFAAMRETVERVLNLLGPTPDRPSRRAAAREVERLRSVKKAIPQWAELHPEWNVAVVSLCAARARAAQDVLESDSKEARFLNEFIPALGAHVNETQPGFVHGLARSHRPKRSSWAEDAQEWERTVRELVEPPERKVAPNVDDVLRRLDHRLGSSDNDEMLPCWFADALAAGVSPTDTRFVNLAVPYIELLSDDRFGELRRAVQAISQAESDSELEPESLPEDWPGFELTLGKRAVLVGGDPRPERIPGLISMFQFASLDWIDTESGGTRRVDALVERMKNGGVDLVIAIRAHSSHKVTKPLFNTDAPACTVVQADNYGTTQLRLGFERFSGARYKS